MRMIILFIAILFVSCVSPQNPQDKSECDMICEELGYSEAEWIRRLDYNVCQCRGPK